MHCACHYVCHDVSFDSLLGLTVASHDKDVTDICAFLDTQWHGYLTRCKICDVVSNCAGAVHSSQSNSKQ